VNSVERFSPSDLAAGRASRTRLFAALPRLSSIAVALRNRVYATAAVVLSDDRILVWQDSPGVQPSGELMCRIGSWPLAITADNLARIEPRLEGFDTYVPTETCAVLVENALSPIIALIERLTGNSLVFEDFRRGAAPSSLGNEISVGFCVFESDMQPLLRGWIRAAPEVWQQMDFARVYALPCRRVRDVPVRMSVQIGKSRLKVSELRALVSGDALRMSPRIARDAESLSVLLTAGGSKFFIRARVAGDALTLEHIVNTSVDHQNPLSEGNDFAVSEEGNADDDLVGDIECDVTFELGSLRLKVSDIGRLRTGQTLRLGVRLQEQPVRVMVNGRWIARGELAAVGDELVVVVTDTSRLPQI
jgi:type III secretion system YscQ/HrcQ family protein